VWNLTNSMLAVIIILLLIILFAMFPVGAYRALSNTAEGNSGGGGDSDSGNNPIICNQINNCLDVSGKITAKEFQALNGPIQMSAPAWYIWSDGWIGTKNFLMVGEGIPYPDAGEIRAAGKIEGKELVANDGPIEMLDSGWYIWSSGWIGTDGWIHFQSNECVSNHRKKGCDLKVNFDNETLGLTCGDWEPC
jgi:hypothetical protein